MRFLQSSILRIGYGALPVTTQAPRTLFEAKKWLFLAIFGQKMRFFGDGGPETLDCLLQNLGKTLFFESSTLKKRYGALQLGAEARRGGFVKWLPCYAGEQVCVYSGVYHEPDPDDVREVGG